MKQNIFSINYFIQNKRTLLAELGLTLYIFCFGFHTTPDYSLIALSFCSALLAFSPGQGSQPRSFTLALIAFLLALAVSTWFSIDMGRSIRLSLSLLPALLLYFIISIHIPYQQIQRIYTVLIFFSLCLCIYLLSIETPRYSPQDWITQANLSFFKVPNDILFLALISPFSFAAVWRNYKSLNGLIALVSLLLCLVVIIKLQSRLALLILLLSTTLTGLLLPRTKYVLLTGICLLLALFVIDALTGFSMLGKLAHQPWRTRLPLWRAAYYMFMDSPVTGNGPGSFLLLYREKLAQYGQLALLEIDPRITPWAHNLFLEVLAELGIAGLLPLLMLITLNINKLRKIISQSNANPLSAVPVFVAWVCLFTSGLFELSLWRQWVFIILFILSGISATILNNNNINP